MSEIIRLEALERLDWLLPRADMTHNPVTTPRWIRVGIPIAAGLFMFALALSAVIVPQLRFLHLLQALIYVAVIFLAHRDSVWGFGAGVIVPVVWNGLNIFVTHLFEAGAEQFWLLLRTGHMSRPDTLLVLVGGIAHFLLIIACLAAFLWRRPDRRQWGQFAGGGLLALAYLTLIVALIAPR